MTEPGTLLRLLEGRRLDARAEQVIFAMVANRALEPLSKLAASKWVCERAWIDGLAELDEDACYRAMDWLLEVSDELAEAVYFQTADLLNLEVYLLFFDTTSTYFERDEGETVEGKDGKRLAGFRTYGKSKDHRSDLPQVVIGMAVTRTGIPIRVWCWPGNTSDQELIRQVKDDLRAWKLSRVVWVADRGFQSAENRRYLQRSGGHYILGEKLRGNSEEAAAALARQGRYHHVAGNLSVKEVVIDEGTMRDRFVVCHNPDEAARDKQIREALLAQLTEAINASDSLSAEDIALGYKQLLEIERGWRDMKTTLDLRPVRHRKEDRIRAHVILCWLALLLIGLAETQTQQTWRNLRDELQRMHLGTFTGPAGTSQQRTELTRAQRDILRALGAPEPPLFLALGAPERATPQHA